VDALTDALGLWLALGDRDGDALTDALGLTDEDGLSDGLTLADGDSPLLAK
jgi:hypothetical protein